MYNNRYSYNNNRAGPSRHSFATSPNLPEDAYPYLYYNDYNYYPSRSQMSNNQQSETLPLRENYNRDRPIQNQKGPISFQSQKGLVSPKRKRGNVNFNPFPSRGRDIVERDTREYKDQGQERQSFKNYRNFSMQMREKSPIQLEQKSDRKNQCSGLSELTGKVYICPGCCTKFDCFARYNYYTGKIPFVLNCKHTLCQECIHKTVTNNSLLCPVCKKPSALPPDTTIDNLQFAFSPNYYLIGMILWSKTYGNSNKFNHMLVSAQPVSAVSKKSLVNNSDRTEQLTTEQCCFHSCNKVATLRCQECNDVYCINCCTVVHKSAKSLWSHTQTAITKATVTLELERCGEHNMDIEFFCKTCESTACCYCFLEQHEGHEKDNLSKLSESEMEELVSIRNKAQTILKQLIVSQRRVEDLYSYDTLTIEEKICNFFANYHAKLQFVEKNLRKEIPNMYLGEEKRKDLDEISLELNKFIEKLTSIVSTCENLEMKKLNLREVLKTLREVKNTPCYLYNQNGTGVEPIEFVVDSAAENIEDYFKLSRNSDSQYKLLGEDDLPPNYQKDPMDLKYESDADSCMSSMIKSVKSVSTKNSKKKLQNAKPMLSKPNISEIEEVEVTHIESLECFYVQLKKAQYRFLQMNREIDNYIKMGAGTVDQPQLNQLYLALYVRNKERMWCRGRVTEFKNGETEPLYEVHFIDHGSTQTLDITKFREITPLLAQRKSFAILCELQNPTYANWDKNAHVYMGKMINGKKVFMSIKDINNGMQTVDLMVSSSDGGLTSIVDILINTCSNPLDTGSENESVHPIKFSYSPTVMIFSNSMKFEKSQIEQVIIANIVDPHHIFVHIAKHAESLKKLADSLKTHYKYSPRNSCIPVEGSYVVVDHKDRIRGNWHRALVKKVDMKAEKAHVLLIDWGMNVSVPWSNIRVLKEIFVKLESQAIMVKLVHIKPFERAIVWQESAAMFLQKYFREKDVLKMIVHNADPLEVALFEVLSDVDICINARLVVENLADSSGAISKTLEWPQNMANSGGFTGDEGLVDSLLKRMDEDDDTCDSDEDDNHHALMRSRISVVKFVNPSVIYIKFAFNENKEFELHKDLQVHYSKDRKMKESWEVGEDCVVLHNLSYARGKILSREDDDKYKVNVYDKPMEVLLPLKKIFEYSKYFNRYVSVVFKAHLADIKPSGGDNWSLSSIETLERVFDKYKDIFGTKTSSANTEKSIPMHMWYTQVKLGGALEAAKTRFISINHRLVKLGFAYKAVSKENSFTSVLEKLASKSDSVDSSANEDIESIASRSSKKSLASSVGWVELVEMEENAAAAATSVEKVEEASTTAISKKGKGKGKLSKEATDKDKEVEVEQESSPYHTSMEEIDDWIPAFPITKEEFNAYVTCAEIEGILYLRDEELQSVYDEMENNIKVYFDKLPKQKRVDHDWQPGQLCTIFSEDYWYRGKVCQVNGPNDIMVIMIDFGSDHNVTAKELYREIMFPKIPAFATKVKLHRVFAKSGAWLSSDYECLMDIISKNAKIVMKGSLDVDIPEAEVFTDVGLNVNQALVQRCPNLTRCERLKDTDESDDDGVVIEEESVIEAEEGEKSTISTQKDDTGTVELMDTTSMKYEQEPLPEEAFTDKTELTVMAVLSYNKVVVKNTTKEVPPAFYALTEEIQKGVAAQPALEKFEVGMACVCPFVDDGVWYRARIHNTDGVDCNYVFVYFVDFGNVDSVSTRDVKMMRPEWFAFPSPCHIAFVNIELKGDNHQEHVHQHTRKLFGKDKVVKVVKKEPLTVAISNSDGVSFYQSLVDCGIVVIKTE